MAKKKDAPKLTYTGKDVDQASADGFLEGMAETYDLVHDAIDSVANGLGEAWAIYNQGLITGERKTRVAELQLAIDTLTHLKDVIEARYFDALDEHKEIARRMEAIRSFSGAESTL